MLDHNEAVQELLDKSRVSLGLTNATKIKFIKTCKLIRARGATSQDGCLDLMLDYINENKESFADYKGA